MFGSSSSGSLLLKRRLKSLLQISLAVSPPILCHKKFFYLTCNTKTFYIKYKIQKLFSHKVCYKCLLFYLCRLGKRQVLLPLYLVKQWGARNVVLAYLPEGRLWLTESSSFSKNTKTTGESTRQTYT